MVMMLIPVMVRVAVYGVVTVADPRHVLFLVDGHDGGDDDNRDDDRG